MHRGLAKDIWILNANFTLGTAVAYHCGRCRHFDTRVLLVERPRVAELKGLSLMPIPATAALLPSTQTSPPAVHDRH